MYVLNAAYILDKTLCIGVAFYVVIVLSDLISHALLELMLCCILCQIQYSSFLSFLRTPPMTVIYIY